MSLYIQTWFRSQCAFFVMIPCHTQGSKLMLANSQNLSYFDNLRVRKISTNLYELESCRSPKYLERTSLATGLTIPC